MTVCNTGTLGGPLEASTQRICCKTSYSMHTSRLPGVLLLPVMMYRMAPAGVLLKNLFHDEMPPLSFQVLLADALWSDAPKTY